MLLDYQEKVRVTRDNLDQVLGVMKIKAPDQIREITRLVAEKGEMVISHYSFSSSLGDKGGDITVFHDPGRGGISFGAESAWGDWDDSYEILTLDQGEKYNCDGKPVYEGDDGSCTFGNI